ncbi:MAG: glycosyltransferase family 87 protein [Blastocatellia bacterium]|nr:glycosyltransferase family 87 protein [Blastocatellia bacterium]
MRFSPGFRRLLPLLSLVCAISGIIKIADSFTPAGLRQKDFLSPYLMARAIHDGRNPYQPMPELARAYLNLTEFTEYEHMTPHTPLMGLLLSPLGLFGYRTAAFLWACIEFMCLLGALALLGRWWDGGRSLSRIALLAGFAIGWLPVFDDLWSGQIGLLILLLFTGAWLALREGNDVRGGALLGGLFALKLMAWPLLFFLLLRGRWRAIAAAGAVVLLAHLAAAIVMGVEPIAECYLRAGPQVAKLYRTHTMNLSAWTWSQRLFGDWGWALHTTPLLRSPSLAANLAPLAPLLVAALALFAAWRARRFDTAFSVLLLAGIVLNPVGWQHYFALALLPIAIIARNARETGLPRAELLLVGLSLLLLSIGQFMYLLLASLFATGAAPDGLLLLPWWAGMLSLLPVAGLLGLGWAMLRQDPNDHSLDPNPT